MKEQRQSARVGRQRVIGTWAERERWRDRKTDGVGAKECEG